MEVILILKALESIGYVIPILERVKQTNSSNNNGEAKELHERVTRLVLVLNEMNGKSFSDITINTLKTMITATDSFKKFTEDFEDKHIIKKAVKDFQFLDAFITVNDDLTRLLNELFISNSLDYGGNADILADTLEKSKQMINKDDHNELYEIVKSALRSSIDGDTKINEAKSLLYKITNNSISSPVTIKELRHIEGLAVEKSKTVEIDFIRDLTIDMSEELGSGSFGAVYLGNWQGVTVAIKKLKNVSFKDPNMFKVKSDALTKNKAILKEVKAFEKLQKSPFILRFYGCTSIDGNLGIVTEYMSNQTLTSWLYYDNILPNEHIPSIQIGVAKGLAFMHENEIAHNDIKSNNIMLDSLFVPRLIDLGMSKITNSSIFSTGAKNKNPGTDQWRSPELWQVTDTAQIRKEFPFAGDVYSFGIVLGEIQYKLLPWQDCGSSDIKDAVLAGKRPYKFEDAPTDLENLIENCWKQNPKDRIKMDAVVTALESIYKSSSIPQAITISSGISIEEEAMPHDTNSSSRNNIQTSEKLFESEPIVTESTPIDNNSVESLRENYKALGLEYNESGKKCVAAKEFLKAKDLFEKSIELGNANAFNNLGLLYKDGKGVIQDFAKAKELFESSAALNDSDAFYDLGSVYEHGYGIPVDLIKAKDFYEQSAALNNSAAINVLGVLYYDGKGVKQDYLKANELFQQSANLGNKMALFNLAMQFYDGKGVAQNYPKAKELYQQSMQLGNIDAAYNLACMYQNGKGVEQDFKKARELFEKCAEKSVVDAIYNLGFMYYSGQGVLQDYLKAKEYYEKSVKLGELDAAYNLAFMYKNGLGVEKDYAKAKELFELCTNDADAMHNLAEMHYKGLGIPENKATAHEWHDKSTAVKERSASQQKRI